MKIYIVTLILMVVQFCYANDGENFIASDILKSMKAGDKAAILMVYFGSTHDDTRELTIDALNRKVKEEYKDIEVRDAFTSRIVIRLLKERGVEKLNPIDALKKLKVDEYTHVIVQSANIIEGIEMEALRRDIYVMEDEFKDIRIGNPLLYSPEDYKDVIKALIPGAGSQVSSNIATIWVGHGTYSPATAQYAMLDYMLKAEGHKDYYVATVEGYPSLDDVLAQIENSGVKIIKLRPFMFVAGDHAKNDIATGMKETLESKGYLVEVQMNGLGEDKNIQDIFIEHLRFCFNYKIIDIIKKKKDYETSSSH